MRFGLLDLNIYIAGSNEPCSGGSVMLWDIGGRLAKVYDNGKPVAMPMTTDPRGHVHGRVRPGLYAIELEHPTIRGPHVALVVVKAPYLVPDAVCRCERDKRRDT